MIYHVGDTVLRRGPHRIERGQVIEVLRDVLTSKSVVYRVRVGLVSHLVDPQDLRPLPVRAPLHR
jgi:hypothetical protein